MNAKFRYLLIALALLLPSLANAQALIRREQVEALLGAPILYANLPASPRSGDTYWVSDVNSACTSGGGANNVVVGWSGSAWVCLGSVGSGGGGISGLTTGTIPKAASATSIVNSSITDDGANVNLSLPPKIGDCSTNCLTQDPSAITGSKTWSWPNSSDTYLGVTAFKAIPRSLTFRIQTGSALADTDDYPDIWENNVAAMHITAVKCRTDTGQSIINLQRNDGSAANILSSNLTCTTSGASSSSFTTGEDAISVGHMIDFVMVTAASSGSPNWITVSITLTLD